MVATTASLKASFGSLNYAGSPNLNWKIERLELPARADIPERRTDVAE
jgi:hypothetical protein